MLRFLRYLKWPFYLLSAVILMIIILNAWVILRTRNRVFADVSNVPAADVGLVLGTVAKVKSGYPNHYFTTRIEAAVRLYKAGKVKKLLVSGDNSIKNYNETEDMKNALIAKGVPARDIVEDFAGFRTLDSVVRANKVFGQKKFIVITQKWHAQRALFLADAHGLDCTGYIAEDPPSRRAYVKIMTREALARVKAVLDCYILGTSPKFPGPPAPIRF